MKQIWITKAGPPEVLEIREVPKPEPGEGEVLVKVAYAGINFADIMARLGIYPDAPPLPAVVGYEISGKVVKVGAGVSEKYREKEILALTRFGGYSEYVVLPVEQLFELPLGMSLQEAAALPVNYLTAFQLLMVMGGLRSRNWVLIHNIGGGVGLAALNLCQLVGATVIGTASSHKHKFLSERGVKYLIDYRTEDFVAKVKEYTGGRGVEIIIDPIGGKNVRRDVKALRPTGRILLFGISSSVNGKSRSYFSLLKTVLSFPWIRLHPINLMNRNIGILGVNVGHLWGEKEMVKGWMEELLEYYKAGRLEIHVDKVFRYDEVVQAHHYIQDRRNTGKVLVGF